MPTELIPLLKDWGFPAALCLYLLWRIDRTFVPGFQAHVANADKMADTQDRLTKALEEQTDLMKKLTGSIEDGTRAALGDHEDIHETLKNHGVVIKEVHINTDELLRIVRGAEIVRIVPQVETKKEAS